jgi:hypothetical protein
MAAFLAVGLLAACAGAAASRPASAAGEPRVVRVTLLLFSGRPNPTFDIEPGLAVERLKPGLDATMAVEAAVGETIIQSRLGYSGIVVENLADDPGLPRTMIIFRNRVETRDGKVSTRAGEGRALEDALVKLALERHAIDEKLLEWIQEK